MRLDRKLAGAVTQVNDRLAEQSALSSVRFSKTVKNVSAARRKASGQVNAASKAMKLHIAALTAAVKKQETRLQGEIAVVSGEIVRNRASQYRVNRKVDAELKRIVRVANNRNSKSSRARGKLRHTMNMYKAAASEEVQSVFKGTRTQLDLLRGKMAYHRRSAAKALSRASKRFYSAVSRQSAAGSAALAKISKQAGAASVSAKA